MAENSYRQSAAGQIPVSDNTPKDKPNIQRANLSVSQTATVAEWARAEAFYRKVAAKAQPKRTPGAKPQTAQAKGWKNVSPYAALSSPAPVSSPGASRVSASAPTRDLDALAALRKDLLAGGRRQRIRRRLVFRHHVVGPRQIR